MSTCISRHGEYSEHILDDLHTCTRCFVLDEDALRAELARLRERLSGRDNTIAELGASNARLLDQITRLAAVITADPREPASEGSAIDVAIRLIEESRTRNASGGRFAELEAKLAEADEELTATRNNRLLSAIFGHHKGAPRPFALYRHADETRVSGTGIVADGVEFDDGVAVLRWRSQWPTSVVFHERGMESIEAVHGHGGKTQIVWLSDELESLAEVGRARDRLLPVVEAAKAWRAQFRQPDRLDAVARSLITAVDALAATDSSGQASAADTGETGPGGTSQPSSR